MNNPIFMARQLKEEIRQREAALAELQGSESFKADMLFADDIQEVLDMHNRTFRDAVSLLDPDLLATTVSVPVVSAEVITIPLATPPNVTPPSATPPIETPAIETLSANGNAKLNLLIGATSAKPAARVRAPKKLGEPPRSSPSKNAKRNARRRLESIQAGSWYLWTNPHTGETTEGSRQNTDTLRLWAAEHGKAVVEGWKTPLNETKA